MGYILSPMMCPCSSISGDAEQVTIGDGNELRRNGGDDLGSGTVVGCVMAGKPVAVVTRLPKGPGLNGARWILRRWLDEAQTRTRFRMILDRDGKLLAVVVGPIERHNEFLSIGAKC